VQRPRHHVRAAAGRMRRFKELCKSRGVNAAVAPQVGEVHIASFHSSLARTFVSKGEINPVMESK
jgi:predicted Fe-Mo cluster-binding NifX family protein